MEEEFVVRLNVEAPTLESLIAQVDTLRATIQTVDDATAFDSLNKELESTKKILDGIDDKARQAGNGLEETADGITSVGVEAKNTKQRLAEMEDALADMADKGSKEYQDLAREAGELKRQVDDSVAAIDAYASHAPRLQVATQAFNAIGGAAQTALGVTALFGEENEELTKSIQQMVAVQSVLNGVNSFAEELSSRSILGMKLRTFWANTFTAAKRTEAIATGQATVAQKVANVVMAANPIMLIVLGIGALIAALIAFRKPIMDFISNWENVKMVLLALLGPIGWIILAYQKLFGEEAKQEDARAKAAEAQRKREAENTKAHGARLKQIEEESKAFRKAEDKKQESLKLEIETLEAKGLSSTEATRQLLQSQLEETKSIQAENNRKFDSWVTYFKNLAILRGQDEATFKESMRTQGVDFDKLLADNQVLRDKNAAAIQRSENELTKFNRGVNKEAADDAKTYATNRLNASRKIEDNKLDMLEDGLAKELEINRVKYERLIEDTYKDENLLASEKLALKVQYQAQAKEVEDILNQEEVNRKLKYEADFNAQLSQLKFDNKAENYAKEFEQNQIEFEKNRQQILANVNLTEQQKNALIAEYQVAKDSKDAEVKDKIMTDAIELADIEIEKINEVANKKIESDNLSIEQLASLNAVRISQIESKYDEEIRLAGENADLIEEIEGKKSDAIIAIKKEESEMTDAIRKKTTDAQLDTASMVLKAVMDNTKEGSRIAKAAAVAQATIDTYRAAQGAYASMVNIPLVGPALGAIAAAAAVASGVANVRSILAVKTPGGGGGAGGSTPSLSTPSVTSQPQKTPDVNMYGSGNEGSSGDNTMFTSKNRQENTIRAVVSWNDIDGIIGKNNKLADEFSL